MTTLKMISSALLGLYMDTPPEAPVSEFLPGDSANDHHEMLGMDCQATLWPGWSTLNRRYPELGLQQRGGRAVRRRTEKVSSLPPRGAIRSGTNSSLRRETMKQSREANLGMGYLQTSWFFHGVGRGRPAAREV